MKLGGLDRALILLSVHITFYRRVRRAHALKIEKKINVNKINLSQRLSNEVDFLKIFIRIELQSNMSPCF